MSGGHFNYEQYKIDEIADSISRLTNNTGEHKYPKHIINEFKKAVELLNKSAIYAQRIDWLVSGDDSEESFMKRLSEELKQN